jgi:hypothetical protein
VARTVGSAWFGLYVKGCAEVVTAAASLQNGQLGYLGCKYGFALFYEQLLKLHGQLRERVSEQPRALVAVTHALTRQFRFGQDYLTVKVTAVVCIIDPDAEIVIV